ncbi:MAG TPA: glycoside hydrolase family 71/99-like protein, partial [Stellaceae bacterium]|nr:glycoside hydrolase family 71/99-like protein [Stellaceae bacterium]
MSPNLMANSPAWAGSRRAGAESGQISMTRKQAMQHHPERCSARFRLRYGAAAVFCLAVIAMIAAVRAGARAPGSPAHFYSSLRGLHVTGYQGWFDCPGDGAGLGWGHWFRGGSNPHDPNSLAIDMWPDTSELGPDELCPTGFHLPSGAPAYLFSDQNPKTVARHFLWMRQYGIDGAAMQRFITNLARPAVKSHLDTVLRNARAGAEANRRGFFVMYDISGMNGAAALRVIERDWPHLTRELRLTESPSYIYDRGKPVVGVWGLGVKDRDVSPAQAAAIIRYFKTTPVSATVLGGVPASWRNLGADARWTDSRTEPGWGAVFRSLDVISPWTVGRYRNDKEADEFARLRIVPDLAETRRLGIEYMPVVFPGFSWAHGAGQARRSPLNLMPRRCGAFYRHQISNVIRSG